MKFDDLIKKMGSKYHTFNPFMICNKKKIPIEYQNIDKPKGDTVYLFEKPLIILSDKISNSNEKYFVCAHELAHVELHNGLQSYYTQNHTTCAKTEHEANLFALNLCEHLYEEENGVYPEYFSDLHNQFGVSEDMMEYL